MENTYQQGSVSMIAYKEGDLYTAVCLELDIIEQDKNLDVAIMNLQESVRLYIETIVDEKFGEQHLNRPAPEKYWTIMENILLEAISKKPMRKSPVEQHYSKVPLATIIGNREGFLPHALS